MQTNTRILAAAALALGVSSSAIAQSASLNFNGGVAANWTGQFNQNNSGQSISWSNTVGVLDQAGPTAGGALNTFNNPSIVYTTSTFSGANTTFTVSASIKGDWVSSGLGNGSGSFIIGFGTSSATAFAGGSNPGDSFAIRLQTTATTGTIDWRTRLNTANATVSGASSMTGLSTSNWYDLTATFTKGATAGSWTYTATLVDLGTSGTGTGSAITNGSISGSFTQLNAWNASSLYAAVNFRSGGTLSTQLDDFSASATAIPEPSAFAALAGLGALGLAATRRRRA